MAIIDLVMPKMGESIMEATILKWVKQPGDTVEEDETILEIATDKVDSEIPAPVSGKIVEVLFKVDDVVEIGTVIARIESESAGSGAPSEVIEIAEPTPAPVPVKETVAAVAAKTNAAPKVKPAKVAAVMSNGNTSRFYSPLVKNIARKEQISVAELESIPGSGKDGRVTKRDILHFVENKSAAPAVAAATGKSLGSSKPAPAPTPQRQEHFSGGAEIIEMDRMRKLIADHMVMSKHTSPHVTSFVEADVTNLFNWRNKVKGEFQQKYGQKITFTPIFIDAVVKAIKDFPMVNISLNAQNQIVKKNYINIGMATALPSGNLIVPVIKNADNLNLIGLTKSVNGLANKARTNTLKPEDIQDGTFTITNVGTFGNVMGTPIINQPQVAILAIGAIRKKPAVVETEYGDLIAVRQMMFLSLSYDHRIVDGFLGGSFLRRVADYLESFDTNTLI